MSNGSELKSGSARRLRAAGYLPCPRWWLTEEQLELVAYMAQQNADEVNRIRTEGFVARAALKADRQGADLEADIDQAWERHRLSQI